MNPLVLPPLSLYIHIPWCVQKCPYCDFNSHAQKGAIPEQDYVRHLIADLMADLAHYQESVQQRPLHSILLAAARQACFQQIPSLIYYSKSNSAFPLRPILKLPWKLIPAP
ncbi:HemN family oxidoreductase [Aggregatibacter aphrophilus]|uniref:HemN family oxidoreductase n=1 Tax=Aggregatibacter aphrophilus TaxID=732 RepID=A0A336N8E2_AGGAP|nr:HemN family oxidoreductase [Aggregatibacter aphrophilus]